jgi:hypothetical protein
MTQLNTSQVSADEASMEATATPEETVKAHAEQLDADEAEFQKLRRDLPGVKGASAVGIQSITVDKLPAKKNAFFRTMPNFHPIIPIVVDEVGMERHFFAVSDEMAVELAKIGIAVADHTLYFTLSLAGGRRIVPIRCADEDGEKHAATDTKEKGILCAIREWVRIYWDAANGAYEKFSAPVGKYGDPQFPELTQGQIFRYAFKDRGRYVDSLDHALFKKFAEGERSL